MTYSGKHARPDFRRLIPRQAGEATPLREITLDDLKAEDALDRSSHDDMHRLLGSIHMRGIRLQSPFYFAGSRRSGRRLDDTVPLVKL